MLRTWADISLMWLIFLTLLAILPIGGVFFYAIKGMVRLRQLAKQYLPIAQEKARLIADKTDEIGDQVASPIIDAYAKTAQVNSLIGAIFRRKST